MAATFDTLMGHCLVDLPGAPEISVTIALNAAARALCLEAGVWEEAQSITLVADQAEYAPVAVAGSVARSIKAVTFNNRHLLPTSLNTVLEASPAQLNAVGEPTHYYLTIDMKVRLIPIPTAAQAGLSMRVDLAFVPTMDATTLPSDLVERFGETLICGAKARMMAMPEKAWSNPQLALFYQNEFTQGVTKARIEKLTDYGRSDLTVKARRFG